MLTSNLLHTFTERRYEIDFPYKNKKDNNMMLIVKGDFDDLDEEHEVLILEILGVNLNLNQYL